MENYQKVSFIRIDESSAGQRLDNFLVKTLKGVPKSRIYRLIRKGEVRIFMSRVKPSTKLVLNDEIRLPPLRRTEQKDKYVGNFIEPQRLIIFENEGMIVVNKPAGIAAHGGSGVKVGLIETLRNHRKDIFPGERLELVHRLDRGTSGCLMISKKRSYLVALQDLLRTPGVIRKHYLALVHGRWPDNLKEITEPLATVSKEGRERWTRVSESGKRAHTVIKSIEGSEDFSLIRAAPQTGRTHQIRVHALWARHPIVGDPRYGDRFRDNFHGLKSRLMLHAEEIVIPKTKYSEAISVKAPTGSSFMKTVKDLTKIDI